MKPPVLPPPTPPAHDPVPARTRRWAAIRRTVGASLAAKVVSVSCTLAQVPIALRYLGDEAYGYWIVLLGLAGLINFVDFGFGVGLQRGLARAFGEDDPATIHRWYRAGLVTLGAFGAAVFLLALPLAAAVNWTNVFRLEDPALARVAPVALLLVAGLFALGLPFNATARLAASVQLGHLHALWIAVGGLLALLAVIVTAALDLGFLWFVGLGSLAPVIQGFGLHLQLRRRLGWPAGGGRGALHRTERRELWRDSVWYAPVQVGQAAVQMLPPVLLAVVAGPALAAAFGVLQRLFSPLLQGQLVLLTPLWPAYTEASARGDRGWIRRAFGLSLAASGLVLLLLTGVAAVAPALVARWIGPDAPAVSGPLVAGIAAWFGAQVVLQPLLYLLVGVGDRRTLAVWGTGTSLAATAFLLLGGRLGLAPALGLGALLQLAALPAYGVTGRRALTHAR